MAEPATQAAAVEGLGPLFVAPQEPDRFWILILLVSVPTIVTACIVLVRGQLPAVLSSSVLLLLPVFGYVLGNLHVLEASKKVRFCGSCHETMYPVLDALRADHETLAAKHYQRGAVPYETACYECHSGYGIWGDLKAKRAGVNHMLHTVLERYDYPLRLTAPFDIDACLGCHAQARPFREAVAHQDADIQRGLIDREMGCTGSCHPAAHPPEALNGVEAWRARR